MFFIAMEKVTNDYDKEYVRMAMLNHEETFREQVYELHRLYHIQKILMKDIVRNRRRNDHSQSRKLFVDPQETDRDDLELTLGSKVYNQRKIKAVVPSDANCYSRSFSSSSTRDEEATSSKQQKRDFDSTLHKQDRLMNNNKNNHIPPWIFNGLSLNMT